MANVSPNIQILGDSMSEACICVSLPAAADTATIDLLNLAYANGGSDDRVAIVGIQSNGSYTLSWDSDSDYIFFYGNGNVNVRNFISPLIMDQSRAGDNPTGNIIITSTEPAAGVGESNGVFVMIHLKKIAGFTGTGAVYKKRSRNIASDGIGGY